MIGRHIELWVGYIRRPSFQTVLANNDRPAFSWFQVLGKQQNSIGKNFGPHVKHHFVASKFRLVVDQS
jgi:hypothetical protein